MHESKRHPFRERSIHFYNNTRLTAFFRTNYVCWRQKGKPLWILIKQEIMEWQ